MPALPGDWICRYLKTQRARPPASLWKEARQLTSVSVCPGAARDMR
jgi:hypothetical protein